MLTRALTAEFLDAGLAARLLMAMPPKLSKFWTELGNRLGDQDAFHGILDKLLTLDFGFAADGEKRFPRC